MNFKWKIVVIWILTLSNFIGTSHSHEMMLESTGRTQREFQGAQHNPHLGPTLPSCQPTSHRSLLPSWTSRSLFLLQCGYKPAFPTPPRGTVGSSQPTLPRPCALTYFSPSMCGPPSRSGHERTLFLCFSYLEGRGRTQCQNDWKWC